MMNRIQNILRHFKAQLHSRKGFSIVEALVGMVLVTIALMGLAQLFILSILQNSRADRMTNATFLARQQIEQIRTYEAAELTNLTSGIQDDLINTNQDGVYDFRRLTQVQVVGDYWQVRVLVFSGEHTGISTEDLMADPVEYRVKADINTIIGR